MSVILEKPVAEPMPASAKVDDAKLTILKTLPSQLILIVSHKYWHCQQCCEMQKIDSGESLLSHLCRKHQINMHAEQELSSKAFTSDASTSTDELVSPTNIRSKFLPSLPKCNGGQYFGVRHTDEVAQKIQLLKRQYMQTCAMTPDAEVLSVNSENSKHAVMANRSVVVDSGENYACTVCGQEFVTQQKLQAHVSRYSKLRHQPAQCKVCERTLHTLDQLNIHIFSDHLAEQSAYCLACSSVFDNCRKLTSHMIQRPGMHPNSIGHTASSLLADAGVCTECEKQVADYKKMVRAHCQLRKSHFKKPTDSSSPTVVKHGSQQQNECGEVEFQGSTKLGSVRKSQQKTEQISGPCQKNVAKLQQNGKKCVVCDVVFNSDRACLLHMLQVHANAFASEQDAEAAAGILMDDTNPAFTIEMDFDTTAPLDTSLNNTTTLPEQAQNNETTTTPQQAKRTFVCSVCGEVLTSSVLLQRHSRVHSQGSGAFSCNQCGRCFQFKQNLEKHKKKHLAGPAPCRFCGKKFLTKEGVISHEKSHHESSDKKSKRLPHKCDKCPASFAKQYVLHDHKLTVHDGATSHQCAICCMTFTHINSLRRHVQIQHEGSKRYVCDTCGEKFAEKKWLVKHQVTHTGVDPYKCEVCSKSFMTQYSFAHHMQRHAGFRPFTCDHCDKSYVLQSHLNRHKKTCKKS